MSFIDFPALKAKQKLTWESGDFGQIAQSIMHVAEEFMGRLPLRPGMRVLDVACGSGNLAVVAARRGCVTWGVDIASNLISQAKARAAAEGLGIELREGDAEDLPYAAGEFDAAVSMFGAMFAPRPEVVSAELRRVVKPGGWIAMANWTPEGFIGEMFKIFKQHLPPPPSQIPSVMLWGNEPTVRARLEGFRDLQMTRQIAAMRYPWSPEETVRFFRTYYGPTAKAFEALDAEAQTRLWNDLVTLQTTRNSSGKPDATEALAEYLEVIALRP